jgi:hypothetical protein
LFQDLTDISGTVDNAKDKNIRFGNLLLAAVSKCIKIVGIKMQVFIIEVV